MRSPLVSPGSRTARSEVGSSATWRPSTSAQNPARVAASAQSKVTARSELLKVGTPFREASAMRAYGRMWRGPRGGVAAGPPGSDGGAAAVGGDDRAGDVAGLRGREEGDDFGDLGGLGGPGEQGGGAESLDAVGRGSRGQDRPGGDGIDPDPSGAELGGPGPGHRRQGRLSGAVGGAAGQADLAGHAGDVDDAAAAPGSHLRRQHGDQAV